MGSFKESLCFVQFIHPGREHASDDGNKKKWNAGNHRRKFLNHKGKYVSGIHGEKHEDTLGFWSEWEPDSIVEKVTKPRTDGPRYIHTPYLSTPTSYKGLQNTDPFIFGDRFKYTTCQQNRKTGPTQLQNLSRGSVILFGSNYRTKFVLDTLFVVEDYIDHSKTDYIRKLKGKVSESYIKATLHPIYENIYNNESCAKENQNITNRLYFGATYEKPVEGMFSFFPAMKLDDSPQGFARPIIQNSRAITDNLKQGYKLTKLKTIDQSRELWENVIKQVIESTSGNMKIGISSDLPNEYVNAM